TILIGLFIVYTHGLWALILGIFGIFCSYYYTAPPLRLAYRGLGELAIWINFGPVLILGSYYLQTHSISIAAILLSIIMGNLIFSVIIANEIPDYTNDKLAGKNTLIVKFGKQFGIFALMIAIIIIFGIIIFTTIIIHVLPMIFISTLLIIPISIKALTILKRTMHLKKIHGNEFIIQFANLFGIILILGTIVMLLIEHLYIEILIIFMILGFFCYLTMLSVSKLISK
ncbi:MAG: prenyltransferase, partial [Gammaproteobacteria bacterium]